MARSNNSTDGQHVKGIPFLPCSASAGLDGVEKRVQHASYGLRAFLVLVSSHPKNSSKIVVESSRTLALSTASKQGARLRCHICSKDQLVLVASTDWTGLTA